MEEKKSEFNSMDSVRREQELKSLTTRGSEIFFLAEANVFRDCKEVTYIYLTNKNNVLMPKRSDKNLIFC